MKPETGSQTNRTAAEEREEARLVKLPRHLKERRSDLQWFWDLGLILLKIRPPAIYRLRWVREELPTMNVSPDLGSKAMAFARDFTLKQVQKLMELRRTWTAIKTVLPVKPHSVRLRLLMKGGKKRRSIRVLRLQVAKVLIVPRVQDREPVPPVSSGPQGDVYRLAQDLERWQKNTALWQEAVEKLQSDTALPREGKKFQILINLVKKAEQQLHGLRRDALQLKKALTTLLEKLKP